MSDINPLLDDLYADQEVNEFVPAQQPFDAELNPEGFSSLAAVENPEKGWFTRSLDWIQRGLDEVSTLFVQDPLRLYTRWLSEQSVKQQYGLEGEALARWRRQANKNLFATEEFHFDPVRELFEDDNTVFRRGMSAGQALAQANMSRKDALFDIADTRRIARTVGTDAAQIYMPLLGTMSAADAGAGAFDAALRLGTDADVGVGKVAGVVRARALMKPLRTQKAVESFLSGRRWAKLEELAAKGDRAAVFNALKGVQGRADLSELLVTAKTPEQRQLVIRYLHGDVAAAAKIADQSQALSRAMSQLADGPQFVADVQAGKQALAAGPRAAGAVEPGVVDEAAAALPSGQLEIAARSADGLPVRAPDSSLDTVAGAVDEPLAIGAGDNVDALDSGPYAEVVDVQRSAPLSADDLDTAEEVLTLKELQADEEWLFRLEDAQRTGAGFFHRTPTVGQAKRAQSAATLHSGGTFGRVRHVLSPDWMLSNGIRGGKSPARLVNVEDADQAAETVRRMVTRSHLAGDEARKRVNDFIAIGTPTERMEFIADLEREIVSVAAKANGLTPNEADELLKAWDMSRSNVVDAMSKRKYDATGRGSVTISFGGEEIVMPLPLHMTQTANLVPVMNPSDVSSTLGRFNRWMSTHQRGEIVREAMREFDQLWRANILLRPAFLTRVMLLDEGPRALAKMAAIGQLDAGAGELLRHGFHNALVDQLNLRKSLGKRDLFLGRQLKKLGSSKAGDLPGLRWTTGKQRLPGAVDERIPGIFGSGGDEAEYVQQRLFQRDGINSLLGDVEDSVKHGLRSIGWDNLKPGAHGYYEGWAHLLNNQLGRDELIRRFLAGDPDDAIKQWLRSTHEGRGYLRHFPRKHGGKLDTAKIEEWIAELRGHVDDITMGDEVLKATALNRAARVEDLKKITDPPVIYGEVFEAAMRQGRYQQAKEIVATGYQRMLGIGMNRLINEPLADAIFRAEVEIRYNALLDAKRAAGQAEHLNDVELARVLEGSRRAAVKGVHDTLTNLSEQGRFVEMLPRFISPFVGAMTESMSRWAGVILEEPRTLARVRQFWQSPEAANLIRTDARGEEYLIVPVPEWARSLPGVRSFLPKQGDLKLNRDHLNMVLTLPTFGPLVPLAVNAVTNADDNPRLMELLEAVFPFGKPTDAESMMSGWERNLKAYVEGEKNRSFANDWYMVWQAMVVDYELSPSRYEERWHREGKPTFEAAKEEAQSIRRLKLASSVLGPATAGWESPYQMHIDTLRMMQHRYGPIEGQARFLEEYGPEYIALTMSLSKNNAGVQPTQQAHALWEKHKDKIAGNRTLTSLVTGDLSYVSVFSPAVYDYQLRHDLKPGASNTKMRSRMDADEIQRDYQVQKGWYEKEQLDSARDLAVAEAGVASVDDLPEVKEAYTRKLNRLRQQNRAWADEFDEYDPRKRVKLLGDIRRLLKDEEVAALPQMEGVATFVALYDDMQKMLAANHRAGGAIELDATSNAPLKQQWDGTITALRQEDPLFDTVYSRLFDGLMPSARE